MFQIQPEVYSIKNRHGGMYKDTQFEYLMHITIVFYMKQSAEIRLITEEIYTMWNNINGIIINTHNNIIYTSEYMNI